MLTPLLEFYFGTTDEEKKFCYCIVISARLESHMSRIRLSAVLFFQINDLSFNLYLAFAQLPAECSLSIHLFLLPYMPYFMHPYYSSLDYHLSDFEKSEINVSLYRLVILLINYRCVRCLHILYYRDRYSTSTELEPECGLGGYKFLYVCMYVD